MRLPWGAIPKCGHVALVLECCYVNICVIFSSSGSLRMRLISQFSRASGARFSETDDSPETVVGGWILPAKLKALLGSSTLLSQVVPGKYLIAESKSPLFGITPVALLVRPSAGKRAYDFPHELQRPILRFRTLPPTTASPTGRRGAEHRRKGCQTCQSKLVVALVSQAMNNGLRSG